MLGVGLLVAVSSPPAAARSDAAAGAPECGTVAGSGLASVEDGVLRVASYNILHSRDDDADDTLDRRVELVAEELAATGADAAGLQEVVASGKHGTVAARVAEELASRTGDAWEWCFFRSNPHVAGEADTGPGGVGGPGSQDLARVARPGDAPWSEGVAVVSRYPIADGAAHRLVDRAPEVPFCEAENPDDPLAGPTCALDTRQVLWSRLATSCGAVDLFSTHLANDESSMSESTRERQVADALAEVDRRAVADAAPDVFVGDFNTLESGPVWRATVDAGFVDAYREAAPADDGFTSGQDIVEPEPTVTRRIDYVFARPGAEGIEPSDAELLGDEPAPVDAGDEMVWPSDHYGVAVTLLDAEACAAAGAADPAPASSPTPRPGAELAATGASLRGAVAVAVASVVLGSLALRSGRVRPSA